ncbi:MAG: choice-of-anchor tandem repeat GloVer-containing protein [Terriglobales bacterium]
MKRIAISCADCWLQAAIVLLLASASAAQYTPVGLYNYPNTDNNTSRITASSFLAQGPDGEFYDTDWSNGEYNSGSVYTISLSGDYQLLYSFCAEGGNCLVTGSNPDGGVTLGSDGNF